MNSSIVLEAETYAALQEELKTLRQKVRQQSTDKPSLNDRLPGCVYQIRRDRQGKLTWPYISAGCQEIFGLRAEDMHRFREIISSDDLWQWQKALDRSQTQFNDFVWQGRIQPPDRPARTLRLTARPNRRPDGSMEWEGLAVAIDDADNHNATLHFLTSLIEKLPVAVVVKSAPDLRFCALNSAGAELLGFQAQDILGKTDADLYPPEQARVFNEVDRRVLQGREMVEIPEEVVQVGDRMRLMRSRKFAIWDGDTPTHLVVVCEDITDRKQAETALAQREQTLRAIVDNAPIWIWTTDTSGHMSFINRTFCENVGITPDMLYQAGHYREVFGDDAVRNCIESDRISLAQDEPCFAEECFPFVDGRIHHLETIKVRLKDKAGRVTGLVGLAVDTTDRKHTEARLQDLNQRYEQLANNLPGVLYQFHASHPRDRGTFRYVSPGSRQLCELEPEDIEANSDCLWNMVHLDDLPEVAASVVEAIQQCRDWQAEFRLQLPSGRTRWIQGRARLRDYSTQNILFDGLLLDISDRKQAEQQLARQRSLLDTFIATAPVGIAILDPQLRYLQVNDRLAQLAGRSPADHFGRSLSEVVPQIAPFLEQQFQKIRQTGTPILDREFSGRTAHNPDIEGHWLFSAFPILSRQQLVAFGCTVIDITERKLAEERLRQSEQQLAQLINATPLAVIRFTPDLNILSWNPGAERIFGYTRQEAIGQSANDLIISQAVAPEVEQKRQALVARSGGHYNLNANLTKDGRTIVCEWYNTTLLDEDGRVESIVSQAIEVTERHRAEAQLQKLTRNLQDAQRIAHIGNWEIDLNSDRATCSEEILRILRLPLDSQTITREQIFEHFHPDDRPLVRDGIDRCIETGQPYDLDVRIIRGDGSLGYVREKCEPQYDASGRLVSIFGIAMDITDRKTTELTLRRSEERFRTLVEATSQIVWMTDSKGCFTGEQPDWTAFTGQDFDTQRNWGWIHAIHPDDRTAVSALWSQAVQTRTFYQVEHRLRRADGEYRDMSVRAVPILEADGTLREWIGVHTDITDRKTAERALQQSEAKLRQRALDLQNTLEELQRTQNQLVQSEKMSALGQLVAGVAHEINNPVNFIYGNLTHADEYARDLLSVIEAYQQHYPQPVTAVQDLMEDVDLEFLIDDLPNLLRSMRVGAQRIRDIVRSLRNFSRLDESAFKTVDLHDGIDSTLTILHNRLKAKPDSPGIEVVKHYGQLPPVQCYAGQLNQVFMNVLSNAIDALEDGDRQDKPSETEHRSRRITITTSMTEGDRVRISIADNGVGIPANVQQHIFDPFFTTKPIGKGTGLGMSISYQIVTENHQGTLACHSQLGQGTEFVIEIPTQQH